MNWKEASLLPFRCHCPCLFLCLSLFNFQGEMQM